jgi:hypothetical protein
VGGFFVQDRIDMNLDNMARNPSPTKNNVSKIIYAVLAPRWRRTGWRTRAQPRLSDCVIPEVEYERIADDLQRGGKVGHVARALLQ